MKLQNGQCRKCLSFGYCYFPKDCGREPPAKSSPLQEQYNWESEFAKAQPDGGKTTGSVIVEQRGFVQIKDLPEVHRCLEAKESYDHLVTPFEEDDE